MDEITKVAEEVKAIESQLVTLLEAQEAERKATGETSEATGKAVATLTQDFAGKAKEMAEMEAKIGEDHEAMQARIDELETKMGRADGPFGPEGEQLVEPGQVFTGSEQYKTMIDSGDTNSQRVHMKSLFPGIRWSPFRKADLLSTAATRLVVPMRDDMVAAVLRQLRMRDLIPVRPTGSNAIEFIRETGFHDSATVAVTSIVISSGVATVTLTVADATLRESERVRFTGCTTSTGLNGAFIWVDEITSSTVFTFNTSLADDAGVTGTILMEKLQKHGAAAEVAEAGTKPEAELNLELVTQPVQTVAHWIPASRQVLADASQLESYVNDRLRYGVMYKEDLQLLYGTGTSPQLQGILTSDGIASWLWSDGLVTPNDTKIDAIRRGMTLSHVNEHVPTGVVVHSTDWEDIQLAKGTDEHYIWASVSGGTEQRFFLLPVVITNAIASGTSLVGAFATGSTLWDREDVTVRVSESHGTFFVENMVAILAEERVCQTLHRPDAFTEVTFDAAPS